DTTDNILAKYPGITVLIELCVSASNATLLPLSTVLAVLILPSLSSPLNNGVPNIFFLIPSNRLVIHLLVLLALSSLNLSSSLLAPNVNTSRTLVIALAVALSMLEESPYLILSYVLIYRSDSIGTSSMVLLLAFLSDLPNIASLACSAIAFLPLLRISDSLLSSLLG